MSLVERLRAKWQALPASGGGSISFGECASHYITDDGKRFVNPDGPEAADELTRLTAENARLRGLIEPTEANVEASGLSKLTVIALRNLPYYLKHADFKNEADRNAALNCFEVIEAELNTRRHRSPNALDPET